MNFLNQLPGLNPIVIMLILLWSMFWKTLALWRASKGDQRYWFIALLLLNTFGLLELIYLFKFAKIKLAIGDLKKGNFLP